MSQEQTINLKYTICEEFTPASEKVLCAVQIETHGNGQHIPTHYMLLTDNSGSMQEDEKLTNVKKCISSMMNFMKPEDYFSLISFESNSVIHINHIPINDINKEFIVNTANKIVPEDMTNLSAGIGNVKKVIKNNKEKTALFLLTDGHINQGITVEEELRSLINTISEEHGQFQIYCVGYGTNHNASLLQKLSIDGNGSYNIVDSIEDVATAFGDTIGGLISITAQNANIKFPIGTEIMGPYKKVEKDGKLIVNIGDIYADTTPIIIAYLSGSILSTEEGKKVEISMMELPSLDEKEYNIEAEVKTEFDENISLTKLRLICSNLLNRVKEYNNLKPEEKTKIMSEIEKFKNEINDTKYDNSLLGQQLRTEIPILERATTSFIDEETRNIMHQHVSYFGLGRGLNVGYSTGRSNRINFNLPLRSVNASWASAASDETENPEPVRMTSASAFQSPTQRTVSSGMRFYSQQPPMNESDEE